jgi:hypothetical protein
VIGLILIIVGAYFLAQQYLPLAFNLIWPLFIVASGLLLIVIAFSRRSEP